MIFFLILVKQLMISSWKLVAASEILLNIIHATEFILYISHATDDILLIIIAADDIFLNSSQAGA